MELIRTISWMKEAARQARAENHLVGLVPTMGALHEGHLSLVRRAKQECSRVYASLFVNPKQFGPTEDFRKYPRAFESDAAKFAELGVDALFAPSADDIYPAGFSSYVNVDGISDRLEGRSRPGHFRGVSTIVLKLFEIVQPDFAYFGRKDAQQVAVIERMVRDLNLNVQIVVCPIVREADGLALSSRNAYLSPEERRAATVLHRALQAARAELTAGTLDALEIQSRMRAVFDSEPLARLDYAEVVAADDFEPVVRVSRRSYVLVAAHLGKTRLLDNMLVEIPETNPAELACHI
ncbi:MAG TPA: pantoate--beta-alanine ligase [Candidatus Dormibacteraeota bacterium]|nr:pantoate--beta-alanine ligase [Candidatus Dormibacteraeota bacterium]